MTNSYASCGPLKGVGIGWCAMPLRSIQCCMRAPLPRLGREVEQQEARVLATARYGEALARRRDALDHRLDLAANRNGSSRLSLAT